MKHFYSFALYILAFLSLRSQVVMNEFCSFNRSGISDFSGDKCDWVELYNTAPVPVSLNGYFISDDNDEPQKWTFPNVSIPAQSFLLVFLSSKDLQAPELHTNFRLSSGETLTLRDAGGNIMDQQTIPVLQADNSYGWQPDAGSQFFFFNTPTPGASNNSSQVYPGYVDKVVISPGAGVMSQPFNLSMSCPFPNAEIRYTLNGQVPGPSSQLYTSPLTLSWHTAIRAKAFDPAGSYLPSETESNSYHFNLVSSLPVVALIADTTHLFNWDSGLFVTGPNASPTYPFYGANYWMDWEYPVHMEYFNPNHSLKWEMDLGMQINGGSVSRTRPMKALRLIAREKYGDRDIDEKFFPLKDISSFRNIVLRNASGDFSRLHFRDAFVHDLLLKHGISVDVLAYRPVAALINGNYWGIYNIRERVSKYYLEENYGVDGNNVDILEEDTLVIEGDFTQFNAMHSFVTGNDMSVAQNFDSADAMVDLPSLCDYFITQTYFSNIDWPYNNIKYWKERSPGNKWRYILLDLDITLGNYNWAPYTMNVLGRLLGPYGDNNRHVQILKSLFANVSFRHYFINRYADLVNTAFSSASLTDQLDNLSGTISTDMSAHMPRWGLSYSDWLNEISNVAIPYIMNRPEWALSQVRDTFQLEKKVNLTLQVWPPGAGEIRINTIQPGPLPWTGVYFDGVPVSITVIPGPDHNFEYWRSEKILTQPLRNTSLYFNPDTSDVITAYFSPIKNASALILFPNPSADDIKAGFDATDQEHAVLEICDAASRVVYRSEEISCMDGFNVVDIPSSILNKGIYLIRVRKEHNELITRFVKL